MKRASLRTCPRIWLVASALLAVVPLVALPRPAHAWAIGSQINETGCHEPITAQALRNARAALDTAPVLRPTRDEAALIDDVLFAPPADFSADLAGMALLLAVRDNDLKGINPTSSLDLIQVHGNPTTQDEHCIRAAGDDGEAGDRSAIAACATYITATATAALDGLDDNGLVDATHRVPFSMYAAVAGHVTPGLPLFYVKIGAAMHALEDSFTHMYRTADGMAVTVVLNWIDVVGVAPFDERVDGPPHRAELDRCWNSDPILTRNYELAIQAATELLTAALDPSLSRQQKTAEFDAVTAKYLGYQPGCTADNHWCDAPEQAVSGPAGGPLGCDAGRHGAPSALVLVGAVMLLHRRRRWWVATSALVVAGALAMPARADDPPPEPAAPAVPRSPSPPRDAIASAASAATATAGGAPAREPGRELKTPTVAEVQAVRQDKVLGSKLGFAASVGVATSRTAAVANIGARYRITERWLVGLDVGWNPWITTSPLKEREGVALAYGTLIRRFPMHFDRVNLRSSLHLGVSTLLFDVYGAPKYSTGPYVAISPLGIDYDFGKSIRLVVDPVEFALPVPQLGQLPLYYEQYRFMVGMQIGG